MQETAIYAVIFPDFVLDGQMKIGSIWAKAMVSIQVVRL